MSIRKQHLKSQPVCKVTFRLPREEARSAESVCLVGEFNDWDKGALPMTRHKNGTFSASINLEPGREYQFRYLLDGAVWENDWHADKYVQTPFGNCDNSVIVT